MLGAIVVVLVIIGVSVVAGIVVYVVASSTREFKGLRQRDRARRRALRGRR